MAQALYRQYRSQAFGEVIGQEHITDLLNQAVSRGAVSHAYLFTGPRGVGKTSVARILAHQINKLPYSTKTHLDIIEIDAASNRRIDDIRDLREKIHMAPTSAPYKVYIIDEVHMLTGESFNALLKTLEEPPAHVIFILATTELHKVPATIVSRTQRYTFRPVAKDKVITHLRSIADKEKIDIDDDALGLIADHGEGSFRDSISLLDQLSSMKDTKVTASVVESLLGLAPHEQIDSIISAVASHDGKGAIATLQTLLDGGSSPQTITEQLLKSTPVAASNQPQLYEFLSALLEVPRSYSPALKLVAVIARAALKPATARTMPLSAPPAAVISAPVPKRAEIQKIRQEVETPKPENLTPGQAPVDGKVLPFDWSLVLEQLHKRYPALHSVLKRAQIDYRPEAITLEFAYSLHRKKMEDSKYRNQLSTLITDLFGACPELKVALKDTTKPPTDEKAAAVAALMGGGEQVDA